MKGDSKNRQIVVRFDEDSYGKINECARLEHRGLGEFVRHAALYYIEEVAPLSKRKKASIEENE